MLKYLAVLLFIPLGASAAAPGDDGFIWIDANTKIKTTPVSASGGASAPEKAPQDPKKEKKDKLKK